MHLQARHERLRRLPVVAAGEGRRGCPPTRIPITPIIDHQLRQFYLAPKIIAATAAFWRVVLIASRPLHMRSPGRSRLNISRRRRRRPRQVFELVGEVQLRFPTFQAVRSDVVCLGCHLRHRERTQPNARLLARFPDFRDPFAPPPLPHSPVDGMTCRCGYILVGFPVGFSGGGGDGGGDGQVIFSVSCVLHLHCRPSAFWATAFYNLSQRSVILLICPCS